MDFGDDGHYAIVTGTWDMGEYYILDVKEGIRAND